MLSNNTFVIESKHKISGPCDNPDECKIGGKLPAAVCKLIIIPPGVVSLT